MRYHPLSRLDKIQKAAKLIHSAHHVTVLTGAGSSTPSGIPDFRSPESGLWNRFSPMEVASLTAFRYQPEQFFEWLRPLVRHLFKAEPNPSHVAISSLEKSGFIQSVITQNIDGLHQRAGSRFVIEVHGSLNTLSCIGCFQQLPSKEYIFPYLEKGEIPQCPLCDCILKPDVILFEEQLPAKPWLQALREIQACDLLLVAGSSLTVTPVAGLPLNAMENDAKIIVINMSPTYIDQHSDVVIHGDVAEIIPAIESEIIQRER